ncbi:MAG: hypothetical protein KIT29_00840 [Anaerolineales bacterium]|nr:hypothetical protein [Anaerolineales bacterium]
MPRRRFLLYLTVASLLAGVALYLATAPLGAGVSEDSAKYMSAAENLVAGRGLYMYNREPMTQWPPGYPAVLAGLHWLTGVDVFVVGGRLNIVLFAANLGLSGWLFWRLFGPRVYTYVAPLLVCTSLGLLSAAVTIASDPLFLTLVLCFLLAGEATLRQPRRRTLALLGCLAALAPLERYVGVSLVAAGAALVFAAAGGTWLRRAGRAAAFGALASLPLLAWVYGRNVALTGSAFGPRAFVAPWLNLMLSVEKVASWFVPDLILRFIPPAAVLLAAVAVWWWLAGRNGRAAFASAVRTPAVLPHLAFVLAYLLVLAFTSSYFEFRVVGFNRIHAILLPSLLILAGVALQPLPQLAGRRGRLLARLVLAALLLFTGYRAQKYLRIIAAEGDPIFNLANTATLQQSALVSYLRNTHALQAAELYSNNEAVLWFYTRQPVGRVPREGQPSDWPLGRQGYMVWFLGSLDYKYGLVPPDEFTARGWLTPVFSDALGVVYALSAPASE